MLLAFDGNEMHINHITPTIPKIRAATPTTPAAVMMTATPTVTPVPKSP